MISTTFVQFQTSTSFPKFSKKLLPPAFNLTCLLSSNSLSSFQSAYRIFHSTETTLLKIHNDLFLAMDRGEVTSLILHDLSAAFDTVDHSILLTRFQNWFGLDGLSLDWFSSYLSLRSQAVSINDSISAFSTLSCGVPQGSVLGPCTSFHSLYNSARWSQKIRSNIICTLMTPSCTSLSLLHILLYLLKPPLSMTFSPGWTNCFSIHQKLNFFSLAQSDNISNFLI